MFSCLHNSQTILENAQTAFLDRAADSYLIDRQAASLSRRTLKFYRQYLQAFLTYCNANAVTLVQELSPDLLRRYFPRSLANPQSRWRPLLLPDAQSLFPLAPQ